MRQVVLFVTDVISGIGFRFRPFWLRLPSPGRQPLDGIFRLKLLQESRLQSESFELFIGFLAFLVQNL